MSSFISMAKRLSRAPGFDAIEMIAPVSPSCSAPLISPISPSPSPCRNNTKLNHPQFSPKYWFANNSNHNQTSSRGSPSGSVRSTFWLAEEDDEEDEEEAKRQENQEQKAETQVRKKQKREQIPILGKVPENVPENSPRIQIPNTIEEPTPTRSPHKIQMAIKKMSISDTISYNPRELSKLLFSAVACGDVPAIGRTLGAGANIYKRNSEGLTPLHVAAIAGQTKAVRCLVLMGAPVSCKDAHGYTPLHRAVLNSRIDVIPTLVNLGADIDETTTQGDTSLHIAAAVSNENRLMSPLLSKNLFSKNLFYRNSLSGKSFARNSCSSTASSNPRFSYTFPQSSRNGRRDSWSTQSSFDECSVIEALIRAGADIESTDRYGETSLHTAVRLGNAQNVKSLVDYGANINVRSFHGLTPLDILATQDHFSDASTTSCISDVLFTHGAIIASPIVDASKSWMRIAVF